MSWFRLWVKVEMFSGGYEELIKEERCIRELKCSLLD
jgi:hypothetical protein